MNSRFSATKDKIARAWASGAVGLAQAFTAVARTWRAALALTVVAWIGWAVIRNPPWMVVTPGEVAVRTNLLTGGSNVLERGAAFHLPLIHDVRRFSLRDQVLRPADGRLSSGPAPYQSVEGLTLGVDLVVRYAVDPRQVARMARSLPPDLGSEVVAPQVKEITYRTFARYTVREIFSTKREEIQQSIEGELRPRLEADGITLRAVQIGTVDLPPDYRHGMEQLLTQELEAEKMRYTLELKKKQVKQTELEAEADKVRRETAANAAAREQIIAAKAQEEAMKHVLPFKQKQIAQRRLEAEAEKAARIKQAEAKAYRLDRVGKTNTEQMAREGELLDRHPLLIQKTVADKLSDKVRVIIAPSAAAGRFIGSGLVGDVPPESGNPTLTQGEP